MSPRRALGLTVAAYGLYRYGRAVVAAERQHRARQAYVRRAYADAGYQDAMAELDDHYERLGHWLMRDRVRE